jgi:class 3 adenylate cyclase
MTETASAAEHGTALRAVHQALYDLWQFGGNALVGWMPTLRGIEVLTVPKIRLFNSKSLPRRVFSGERLMDRQTFNDVSNALGVQSVELRLPLRVGDGPGALPVAAIEPGFSRFAVTRTEHRAVILFDIVGFSRFSPEEQACQLATLEFALNIAVEATREQGIALDADRSTTGDGFYVWNRNEGFDADVNLFAALVMFLTYHSLLRRRVKLASAVPTIRTAISIGSHYAYRQPNREGTRESEYIVGDVTISLARLMAKTAPEQFMIGDFKRPDEKTGEVLSADNFVNLVAQRLQEVKGLSVLGNKLQRFSLYLTGPRLADGNFGIQKLKIVDKHGFEHFGYNGKVNVFLESGETFYCGLQHVEKAADAPA